MQIDNYIGATRSQQTWTVIKSLRNSENDKVKITLIQMEEWTQHYEDLLSENSQHFIQIRRSTTTASQKIKP